MSGEFESAFRQMLKSVVREVADEIVQEQQCSEPKVQSKPPELEDRLLLRAREAAMRLAISERHLHKLTVEGVLPFIRVGRLVRYSVETIAKWIRESESADAPEPRPKRAPTERKAEPVEPVGVSKPRRKAPTKRAPAKASQPTTTAEQTRASATERRQNETKPVEEKLNPFRLLLKEMGIDREDLGSLSNGELMRIAEVELPTFHGWMYLGRQMPEEALEKLRRHCRSATI